MESLERSNSDPAAQAQDSCSVECLCAFDDPVRKHWDDELFLHCRTHGMIRRTGQLCVNQLGSAVSGLVRPLSSRKKDLQCPSEVAFPRHNSKGQLAAGSIGAHALKTKSLHLPGSSTTKASCRRFIEISGSEFIVRNVSMASETEPLLSVYREE
jgi:hypothetical protein